MRIGVLSTLFYAFWIINSNTGMVNAFDISKKLALEELQRLSDICENTTEPFWDIAFCGHTLFVDSQTGEALGFDIAGKKDLSVENLTPLRWPDDWPLANTTRYWQKKQWAVLIWPMQGTAEDRLALMLHESYHRTQGIMKFSVGRVRSSSHLDDAPARILIRTEARYLSQAINASSADDRLEKALKALAAYVERTAGDDTAQSAERYQMLYEGLAEYTGQRLARKEEGFIPFLTDRLAAFETIDEFGRSFAYYLAPAWGALLDDFAAGWRLRLESPENLPEIFYNSLNHDHKLKANSIISKASVSKDFADIAQAENDRHAEVSVIRNMLRARFIEKPVIVLPAETFQIDPSTEISLGRDGKVFQNMEISGEWGHMTAWGGAMIGPRPPWVYLELFYDLQEQPILKNDQYRLDLAEGWTLVPHQRGLTVAKQ